MVLSLLRPQWYTSLLHLCTTRDSFPVRVLMGILHVILSLLQFLLKMTICPLHVPVTSVCVCVCVCCTRIGLRCTFLTYVRARTVVILSSLHVPVTYIPECTADEFFSSHKRAQNNTPYRLVVLTFKGSISQVAKKTKR